MRTAHMDKDTGCHRHPDCFTCPFPDCKATVREIIVLQGKRKKPSQSEYANMNDYKAADMRWRRAKSIERDMIAAGITDIDSAWEEFDRKEDRK